MCCHRVMQNKLSINRDDLIAALMATRYGLTSDCDETDVRLVVYEVVPGGSRYSLESGDVSFDLVHGAYCGASMISMYDTNDAIRETADDLISQVEDQHAESTNDE